MSNSVKDGNLSCIQSEERQKSKTTFENIHFSSFRIVLQTINLCPR